MSGALALLAAMPTPALAAQVPVPSIVNTNQFFIDDTHTPTGQGGNWAIDARTLTYSRNTKECRPSTEDPEGNWGLENRGLMCSARMVNRVIGIGDPILVMITLRNVGDVPVAFRRRSEIHIEFNYTLFRVDDNEIEPWPFNDLALRRTWFSSSFSTIFPGFQHRETVDISEVFPVDKPGIYNLTVTRRQEVVNPKEYISVVSGLAEFTMIARPDGINRPRARPEGLRHNAEQLAQEKAEIGPAAFARNHYGRKIIGSLDKLTPAERSNVFSSFNDVVGRAPLPVASVSSNPSNEVKEAVVTPDLHTENFSSRWGLVVGIVVLFGIAWTILRTSRS